MDHFLTHRGEPETSTRFPDTYTALTSLTSPLCGQVYRQVFVGYLEFSLPGLFSTSHSRRLGQMATNVVTRNKRDEVSHRLGSPESRHLQGYTSKGKFENPIPEFSRD